MSTHSICFLWRTKENYPLIITIYPPYLLYKNLSCWLQSGAATMAFNAQGGVFQQHLQALVNVPGMPNSGQFTVQQARKLEEF